MSGNDRLAKVIRDQIAEEAQQAEASRREALKLAAQERQARVDAAAKSKLEHEQLLAVGKIVNNAVLLALKDIVDAGFISATPPDIEVKPIDAGNGETIHELARLNIVRTKKDIKAEQFLMISFLWKQIDPQNRAIVSRYGVFRFRPKAAGKAIYVDSGDMATIIASDVLGTWYDTKEVTPIAFTVVTDEKIRCMITDVIAKAKDD